MGGGGQKEDRKRICDEEWGYGLSIKYHKRSSNPIQSEQSPMRESPYEITKIRECSFNMTRGYENIEEAAPKIFRH